MTDDPIVTVVLAGEGDEEVLRQTKERIDKRLREMGLLDDEKPYVKPDDMRLCKYSLTLEAYIWSIIACPIVALFYIFKYVNWCLVASLFRLLWLPIVAGSMLWTSSFTDEWCATNSGLCATVVIIWFVGSIVGLASWATLLSDRYGTEHDYIKSKWLWK